jgi:voltage-gated potassium channel
MRTDLLEKSPYIPGGARPYGHLLVAATAIAAVTVAGTAGYMIIEGMSPLEAFYMTVITLSTVGYHEVTPLGTAGRIFTVILIIVGVGTVFYSLVSMAEFLIEGRLRAVLGRRSMKRSIEELRDHVILCGYGRIGSVVAEELEARSAPFVVVEADPALEADLDRSGYLYVLGSALEDGVLVAAGIERAQAVVAAMASDADNVFVTLSARELNPAITVHARASTRDGIQRLKRAGAKQVISPHQLGGRRIANAIVRPTVVDFIELASAGAGAEIDLEEIVLAGSCGAAGLALRDLPSRGVRVAVVAIKRGAEPIRLRPGADDTLQAGDRVIAVGDRENLRRLADLAAAG